MKLSILELSRSTFHLTLLLRAMMEVELTLAGQSSRAARGATNRKNVSNHREILHSREVFLRANHK